MAPPTAHQYPQAGSNIVGHSTLPEYTVATTFVYSDGSWEKVVETKPVIRYLGNQPRRTFTEFS